jgi:hypothetical protein
MIMKKITSFTTGLLCASFVFAQTYPDPEFSNEVYFLKKDNPYTLVRLEKSSAKMENKVNVIKGAEFGYAFDGKTSPVRFSDGSNLSFVFSNGASSSSSSNSKSDSTMRANGVDPNMFGGMTGGDPSSMISLYKLNIDGDSRKIYMQKSGGYFSSHKNQSSDKYTFSLKKIREGYWVLVVDKPLPKGEYAFSMMGGMSSADMSGAHVVFAFGID